MSATTTTVMVAAALVLGAFAAGRLTGASSSTTPSAVAAPATTPASVMTMRAPSPAAASPGVSPGELRAIVRDELAARDELGADVAGGEAPPSAPRAPSDAALRAGNLADDAIASGRWSAEDAAAFHAALGELDADEQRAVLSTVARAVNEQRLDPTGLMQP
jgi:hypothetical protein